MEELYLCIPMYGMKGRYFKSSFTEFASLIAFNKIKKINSGGLNKDLLHIVNWSENQRVCVFSNFQIYNAHIFFT